MIWLTHIPMPPSSNNAYASIQRFGKMLRVPSKQYKDYKREFEIWRLTHLEQVNHARALTKGWTEAFEIHCEFFFQKEKILTKAGLPKKNDTSNRLKILHDLLSQSLQVDDSYFWNGSFTKNVNQISDLDFVDVAIDRSRF